MFTSEKKRARIALAQPGQVIAAEQTKGFRRGKSGLRRAGCRITSGGGDSKASATEIYRQCLTLSVELIGKGGKAV